MCEEVFVMGKYKDTIDKVQTLLEKIHNGRRHIKNILKH